MKELTRILHYDGIDITTEKLKEVRDYFRKKVDFLNELIASDTSITVNMDGEDSEDDFAHALYTVKSKNRKINNISSKREKELFAELCVRLGYDYLSPL